jgi:hypothetical protein
MVWKNQMMLGGERGFEENWDNLDAWNLNVYAIGLAHGNLDGTASVSGGRVSASSYGSGPSNEFVGPSLAYEIPDDIGDFTISFDIEADNTDSINDRFRIGAGVANSSDPDGDCIYASFADNTSSYECRYRVRGYDSTSLTTFESSDGSGADNYTVNVEVSRTGSTLSITWSGSFNGSTVESWNADKYDLIIVQFGAYNGTNAPAMSIGPITLEY